MRVVIVQDAELKKSSTFPSGEATNLNLALYPLSYGGRSDRRESNPRPRDTLECV